MEVLLTCARNELDPHQRERLRALVREVSDWERLFSMAGFNKMIPFLYWHLSAVAADLVPGEPFKFLKAWFLKNADQALGRTANLLELLHRFDENGILAVPYKGPALASRLYGNVALRQVGDLDILVARRDISNAVALLGKAGFHPRHSFSPAARKFLIRNRYSEIFDRDSGPTVELHWAFAGRGIGFPLELEQLRTRLHEQSLGGSRVPAFGTEDQLLILCVHGAKHCWNRLEWLSGVSELMQKEVISWPEAIDRAIQLRAEKILLLGLFLAHDLLGAPVPRDVIEVARSQRDVMLLAKSVRRGFAETDGSIPKPPGSLARDLFRLRLQPTGHAKLRYLFYRMTTPRRHDTRLMVSLGNHPVPLPSFIRPFRMAGKLILGFLRHPGRPS
jgi:hypothetical protein